MSALTITPVSFSYDTAAAATGFSADVIKRAVKAGDLAVKFVSVKGDLVRKPVIERAELERWVTEGAAEWSA